MPPFLSGKPPLQYPVTATLAGLLISICTLIIVIGKLLVQGRIAQSSAIANTGLALLAVFYFVRQIWVVLSFTHGSMPSAVITWIMLCMHSYIVPAFMAAMFSVQFYIITTGAVLVTICLAASPHIDEAVVLQLALGSICLGAILYTIEQTHRVAFLAKLNAIRLQSELQASETSRLEEQTQSLLSFANRKRQEADLERAKIQLMTMTCAPSEEADVPESLRQITKVQRVPRLKKAWEVAGGGVMEASTSNSKFPCFAITSTDDIHYSGRALSTKGVIGREKVIREGSHSFVKVPGEAYLRVSSMAKTFGSCPGHPMLASESQVQYAGVTDMLCHSHAR